MMAVEPPQNGTDEMLVRPPTHPVPTLQGPFEESMDESVFETLEPEAHLDALARRAMLLDSPTYERVVAGRWKQKTGEKYHPIWKLVSQMAFGLHLLAQNMAKSEDEVMKILQAHVDDIDSFLERTGEDFDLAQTDLEERLRCLNLPLQHGRVFDKMLKEANFRASILEGNEKIEHIISRTKRFIKDSLKDVRKGIDATTVLDGYVTSLGSTWDRQSPEHEAVFVAMAGNVEGWQKAFAELHEQGSDLSVTLRNLTKAAKEMARRAKSVGASPASFHSVPALVTARISPLQKPLPSAPGQRPKDGGHGPSKSTSPMTEQYNRPTPAAQRRRGLSLDSSRRGEPPPSETSGTAQTETAAVKSLEAREPTGSRAEFAVELPADVPETALRNAPVSIRNRLSSTLGLPRKSHADHRISSIYYPRALGALLKVHHSPKEGSWGTSAVLGGKKSEKSKSGSTQSTPDRDHDSAPESAPSGYFSTPTKDTEQQRSVRSPAIVENKASRKPSIQSPGLSSHPAVMAIVERPPLPVELPTQRSPTRAEARRQSQAAASKPQSESSGGGAESSLGEPGPEIEDTGSASDPDRERTLESVVDPAAAAPDPTGTVATPVQSQAKSNEMMNGDGQVYELCTGEEAAIPSRKSKSVSLPPVREEEGPDAKDGDESAKGKLEGDEEGMTTPAIERKQERLATAAAYHGASLSTLVAAKSNEVTTRSIIAELEAAMVHQDTVDLVTPVPDGDLEASREQFRLSPRTSPSNTAWDITALISPGSPGSSTSPVSPTVQPDIDLYQSAKNAIQDRTQDKMAQGLNRGSTKQPKKTRPLKLKLTKLYGKMVPVQVHRSETEEQHESPANETIGRDTIEQTWTTPGSPVHMRTASLPPGNSASIHPRHTSQQLVPPEAEAIAGASTGEGPAMTEHDEVENESKARHARSSNGGGSLSRAKSLLKRADDSVPHPRHRSTQSEQHNRSPRSGMLTPTGKDVLWFPPAEGKNHNPTGISAAT